MNHDYRLGRFGIHVLELAHPTMALWRGANYLGKSGVQERGVLLAAGRWALFVSRIGKGAR